MSPLAVAKARYEKVLEGELDGYLATTGTSITGSATLGIFLFLTSSFSTCPPHSDLFARASSESFAL